MKILKVLIILILIVNALQVSAEAQKKDYSASKEEAQDVFISRCVEDSAGNGTKLIEKDALAKCKFRKLKTNAISIQAKEIKLAARNEFIELQQGKMLIAVDNCKTGSCKDIFKKRIERLNKLQQKYQDKLKTIEEIKLNKIKEFNDLKRKPYFVKYERSEDFKARSIDPIKLDISRKEFIKAEQNFISMKERARITKQQFDKAKIEILNCTIGNSTEVKTAECDETRETLNTKAKEHLINTVNRILEQLNKLRSKIESNDGLTEEEASEMGIAINEQIKSVDSERIKIENSKNKKEIIESAKRLNGVWARIKQSTSLQTQRTVNARIGGIIIQLKQLGIKLERVLARITEDNVDISKIRPLVEKFDENVEEARINYEGAQDKFIAAKSQSTPDAIMIKEAQGYMENAHAAIQESQENLKEIVLAIKKVGGVKSLESESEEDIEEQLEGQG